MILVVVWANPGIVMGSQDSAGRISGVSQEFDQLVIEPWNGSIQPDPDPHISIEIPLTDDGGLGSVANPFAVDDLGATATPESGPTPIVGLAFPGVTHKESGSRPPDTCGAMGPTHFVSALNGSVAVFDRIDGSLLSEMSLNDFFRGLLEERAFDPRVVYDQHDGRFVIIAADNPRDRNSILVAVSQTSDPLGTWVKARFMASVGADFNRWADYPTLGVTSDGIYVTANMFAIFGASGRRTIWAIDKAPLVAAEPELGTVTAFRELSPFTIQPAHAFGDPGVAYLVASGSGGMEASFINVLRVEGPMTSPTLVDMGRINVSPYASAPNAAAMGSSIGVNVINQRLLMAVYRNESIWTCHNINVNGFAACRWYEIRPDLMRIIQSGTIPSGGRHYYYPSIMVNAAGHAAMGFSGSNAGEFIGSYSTGKLPLEPAGSMGPIELLKEGEAVYDPPPDSQGRLRWGDYSYTSVDPLDDMTFWTIQEYAETPEDRWGTWIAELSFSDCPPPAFDVQPADLGACVLSTAMLTAVASGDGPISYQWQKNATNIPGATDATLVIDDLAVNDESIYRVVATDGCTSAVSRPAFLRVGNGPDFVEHPESLGGCVGGTVMLSGAAESIDGDVTYQWLLNGQEVAGATSTELTIDPIGPEDFGIYQLIASDACSSTSSLLASLGSDSVQLVTEPVGRSVCAGDTVVLNTIVKGDGPITYQWQKDGEDIPGAQSFFLFLDSADALDSGAYRVLVTNPCGVTISQDALVEVRECILGDSDGDGDVDLVDFAQFQLCFGGPGVGLAAPVCDNFDSDRDGDVDLIDLGSFQLCFTGSAGMVTDPSCLAVSIGSCCVDDSCQALTFTDCESFGGVYLGPDSGCDEIVCP